MNMLYKFIRLYSTVPVTTATTPKNKTSRAMVMMIVSVLESGAIVEDNSDVLFTLNKKYTFVHRCL